MQHYRGINLVNTVQLVCQDGSTNQKNKQAVDKLVDRLEETGYTLIGAYKSTSEKIKGRCNNGHNIMIKPNDFVSKKAGCKHCFYLNRHAKIIEEFNRVVKRKGLTLQKPLNFDKGYLHGLNETYLFTCRNGHEHWLSPIKLVKHIIFQCEGCMRSQ